MSSKLTTDDLRLENEEQQDLLVKNKNLALWWVEKYLRRYPEFRRHHEEFVDVALMALFRAIRLFRKDKGFTFATFAWRPITHHLDVLVLKLTRNKKINAASTYPFRPGTCEEDMEMANGQLPIEGTVLDKDQIDKYLACLPPTWQEMIRARYLEGKTLDMIAKKHKLTRERIRQLTEKGIKKIRAFFHIHIETCENTSE
jgi:RNA polymerase sigma factor (sigma-70 family)